MLLLLFVSTIFCTNRRISKPALLDCQCDVLMCVNACLVCLTNFVNTFSLCCCCFTHMYMLVVPQFSPNTTYILTCYIVNNTLIKDAPCQFGMVDLYYFLTG